MKEDKTRVHIALDLIEEAQRLIERAGQELSPVAGAADEWHDTMQLYSRIKRQWYQLDRWQEKRMSQNGRP